MRRGGGRCKDRRGSAKRGGAILTRTLLLALDSVNKRNKLIPRFTANCFTTVYGYDVTYSASLTLTPSLSLSFSPFLTTLRSFHRFLCRSKSRRNERGTSYRNCASLNYEQRRLRDLFLRGGTPAAANPLGHIFPSTEPNTVYFISRASFPTTTHSSRTSFFSRAR